MDQAERIEVEDDEPKLFFKNPEKPTLQEIVRIMDAMDDAQIKFDAEQHKELLNALSVKVDNYKRFFDRVDAELERVKSEKAEIEAYRKRLLRTKTGLENLLITFHKAGKLVDGKKYRLKIRKSTSTEPLIDANLDLYKAYGDLIKVSYDWDKTNTKKYLKAHPKDTDLRKFVDFKTNFSVDFELKKEISF